MVNSRIVLSEYQCRNVVKVQIAEMTTRFNPRTIGDDDTLADVDIDTTNQVHTLKLRITSAIVIADFMDSQTFLEALDFTSRSTVGDAAREAFAAQTRAMTASA
jgi:hypothetical protein